MHTIQYVTLAILAASTFAVHAQTMYRCGSTYADQPCALDAKVLNAPKPKAARLPDLAAAPEVEKRAKEMCRRALMGTLKDPESARFGMIYRGALDQITDQQTGKNYEVRRYGARINAKNSYGGYTGEKRFGCAFNYEETELTWAGPAE